MYVNELTGWHGAATINGGMRVKIHCVHAVCHVCMGGQSEG